MLIILFLRSMLSFESLLSRERECLFCYWCVQYMVYIWLWIIHA